MVKNADFEEISRPQRGFADYWGALRGNSMISEN